MSSPQDIAFHERCSFASGTSITRMGLAAYLAGERDRFLAIVCTGNPYAAV
jgi:hypothetical protein